MDFVVWDQCIQNDMISEEKNDAYLMQKVLYKQKKISELKQKSLDFLKKETIQEKDTKIVNLYSKIDWCE